MSVLINSGVSTKKEVNPLPPVYDIKNKSAFSQANTLKKLSLEKNQQILKDRGIRTMPYPFGSAMAVVSDLDATTRDRFDGYTEYLVGRLGLDFGDSFWLQWRGTDKNGVPTARETGFYSNNFGYGRHEPASRYWFTRTFNEALHQFHQGNLDHFHSLLPAGPRALILDEFTVFGSTISAKLGELEKSGQLRCKNISVLAAVVISRTPEHLQSVTLSVISGKKMTSTTSTPSGDVGMTFDFWDKPENAVAAFDINQLNSVDIQLNKKHNPSDLQYVVLLAAPSNVLLDRLKHLHSTFGVEAGLVTDHASFHFRNENAAKLKNERLRAQYDKALPLLQTVHGTFYDDDGNPIFTTDADDPKSVSRVFPEISSECGLRFVNPAGCTASSTKGWEPLNLVTPALTRAGSGIYVARRSLPNIEPPPVGKTFDGTKSQHNSFVRRIEIALQDASTTPNQCWPIYTHLGALCESTEARRVDQSVSSGRGYFLNDGEGNELNVPSPYFEQSGLNTLQDRVFNISGDIENSDRMWFTRASVLYEYSLILRSIADHVTHVSDNHIVIKSWYDPVLDRKLPVNPAQLYGITFYVEDSATAKVFLDDQPLLVIARNNTDETGRQSVTLLESEIRHVFFSQLNPLDKNLLKHTLTGATWNWHPASDLTSDYGRLDISQATESEPVIGMLTIDTSDLKFNGSQLCTFKLRVSPGLSAGVWITTKNGGHFLFGHKPVADALDVSFTAQYHLIAGNDNEWETIVVPFHDLDWDETSQPDGDLPSHPIKSITIVGLRGYDQASHTGTETQSTVDIGEFYFCRPRATMTGDRAAGFCLTGHLPGAQAGHQVILSSKQEADEKTAICDPRGYFCFTGLKLGVYSVRSIVDQRIRYPSTGKWFEVVSDQTHVILES